MKKIVTYITNKKNVTTYAYEKLPQENQMKKKLYILEAYTKSIKKYKSINNNNNANNAQNQNKQIIVN